MSWNQVFQCVDSLSRRGEIVLLRHGFDEDDLAGPSPRLVDAIVVCGNVDAVVRRVAEHHDAGADHVCIQVLTPRDAPLPMREWTDLAAAFELSPTTV